MRDWQKSRFKLIVSLECTHSGFTCRLIGLSFWQLDADISVDLHHKHTRTHTETQVITQTPSSRIYSLLFGDIDCIVPYKQHRPFIASRCFNYFFFGYFIFRCEWWTQLYFVLYFYLLKINMAQKWQHNKEKGLPRADVGMKLKL